MRLFPGTAARASASLKTVAIDRFPVAFDFMPRSSDFRQVNPELCTDSPHNPNAVHETLTLSF
jgi:hypothetical protein